MNRAEVARAVAVCEALAKELRAALSADALAEFEEQGTRPTWRMDGVTVAAAFTRPGVEVVDEEALVRWVASRHPTEITQVIRPAFRTALLAEVAERGDPPCSRDGEVIPGLMWRRGGEFSHVTVKPAGDLKRQLHAVAVEMVTGQRPLPALPLTTEDGDQP